jgi:hypothetical protein
MKSITKLVATLTLATIITLTACEEKKKQDSTDTTATEAASEAEATPMQEASQEVAATAADTSCGNGGGDVKLLECITYENKFVYDKQNRIVKIYKFSDIVGTETLTIAYGGNDSVTFENVSGSGRKDRKEFVKNGNTITVNEITAENESYTHSFTINGDGYIINRAKMTTYEYENGNLISKKEDIKNEDGEDIGYVYEYRYDNKKSPFSNSNTPKWLFDFLNTSIYSSESKNNVVYYSFEGSVQHGDHDIKYEYDKDGFPTKCTDTYHIEGEEGTDITNYTYYGSK